MKKLISHIRTEWYKYLLEILVITIGILGAFALNNWNEGQMELAQEQELLKQLAAEYRENLDQLEEKC